MTKRGFSMLELLVVIFIIGVIASISVLSYNSIRSKSRDTTRISNISEIQSALERYRADEGFYPATITPGQALIGPSSGKTYLTSIPSNPLPVDNANCANSNYLYETSTDLSYYYLTYCLANNTGGVSPGNQTAIPEKIWGGVRPILTYGNGYDNNVSVTSGVKNINTDTLIAGRSCADAPNYVVTALTANTATLSPSPSAACMSVGDLMVLINLRGTSSDYANTGNYEILAISAINGATVTFASAKTKNYGNVGGDANIDSAAGDNNKHKVILQRIPQYNNLTVDSGATLTASSWSAAASKGGLFFIKVKGTLTVNGTITMSGTGFAGGATNTGYCGQGGFQGNTIIYTASGRSVYPIIPGGGGGGNGGGGTIYLGGAGGTFGILNNLCYLQYLNPYETTSYGPAGAYVGGFGGCGYGANNTNQLFMGSGGGGGGTWNGGSCYTGAAGGAGGGIIYIQANQLTVNGSTGYIVSNGATGGNVGGNDNTGAGGGGSGGMIILGADTYSLGSNRVTVSGGAGGGGTTHVGWAGSAGRLIVSSPSCVPSCTNKYCGSDGCGGSCGTCALSGLIDWWKFEGNTTDSGSSPLTPIVVNNITYTSSLFGQAAIFNSASPSYINFGNVLNMGTASRSIAMWFKTSSASTCGVLSKSSYRSLFGRWGIFNGDVVNQSEIFGQYGSGFTPTAINYAGTYSNNNWHFLTAVWDRAGNQTYYMDGRAINSVSIAARAADNMITNDYLIIGGYGDASGYCCYPGFYYNGQLDEIQIYNRALSSTEVTNLYNSYISL